MSVSIKFESNQSYQADAIDSVVSLFSGWSENASSAFGRMNEFEDESALFNDSLHANPWGVTEDDLIANIRQIQSRVRINPATIEEQEVVPKSMRLSETDLESEQRDFSVEMETGTGKTYVYLRTILELYKSYKMTKFVIVVPNIAIREGVLKSLELMKDHFKELYPELRYDSYVYDSKSVNRVQQFATGIVPQILVMNIQAFARDELIINRPDFDKLRGHAPKEFIRAVKPVVIMDEPQKLEGPKQKAALESLNALFRLRYSATHKDHKCLVYRLGPVDAYQQKLVKQISVLSMTADEDLNIPYVEISSITPGQGVITATATINKTSGRKQVTLRLGSDLREESGLELYSGWIVEDIRASTEEYSGFVHFTNGQIVAIHENNGVDRDWWQYAQIRATVEKHFEAEARLARASSSGLILPTKALTLFFIDKVANFVGDEGKFRIWFDEIYESIRAQRKHRNVELPSADKVRAHYFASDRGALKDSREKSDSADDAAAYNLIMKDKEALISLENPVRFIFSHSALAEGWDNPNVFTICNLQETQSVMKRRQQIGRGLRLPVMANGERCRVDELNVVTVIASETFEKYADGLQREIAEDTGERVVGMVKNERQRPTLVPKSEVLDSPVFKELWRRIAPKSRFRLDFDSQDVIDEAVIRLQIDKKSFPEIVLPKIRVQRGRLRMDQVDVEGQRALDLSVKSEVSAVELEFNRPVPFTDILKDLSTELAVSRNTIYEVIMKSGRLAEGRNNPAVFRKYVSKAIQQALSRVLVDKKGIRYTPILAGEDRVWSADFFAEVQAYQDTLVPVTKSIYDQIPCDSDVEKRYAAALEEREDIEFFLKLPSWFKVATPVGGYNPDWAIVRRNQKGEPEYLYLVRETKGTTVISNLRFESEGWKIHFGREHFKAIQIDYKVNKEAYDLDLETPMTFDDDLDSDDRT